MEYRNYGFGNVTLQFSTEPAVITNARKDPDLEESDEKSRDLVFAIINNRKVFDAVCKHDDYEGIEHAINEVLIDGVCLTSYEVKSALADYDKIMGIKPAKSKTEIKIDRLEAELKELRANLHKA